jgi:hypothetical protein
MRMRVTGLRHDASLQGFNKGIRGTTSQKTLAAEQQHASF